MTKGTWPDLKPNEIYFLRLMLSAAILFVRSVVVGRTDPPTTIFPFPDAEVASVALWLFVGVIASRRATRNPMATWADYWRHFAWLCGGIWLAALWQRFGA